VVFINVLDSLMAPCLVYNMVIYIQYTAGSASMASAWFIHWPVRPVCGLYGHCLVGYSLAIITPSVFSTISVLCYLTGMQIKKYDWWLCYVLACDELTV